MRMLQKKGAEVECILTEAGERFITTTTLQALLKKNVYTRLFGDYSEKRAIHIPLAEWADCIVIMPATANTIAKIAHGIADNLLTSVVLATEAPCVIVPAMHSRMWLNSITQEMLSS